jgi:LytS/YehU family sensor histidine kinase
VQVSIDPDALTLKLPPMILQSLVENALKHGIAHLPEGGDVRIHATCRDGALVLEVENSGELIRPQPGAAPVGLNNIRERLRILYGDRASLALRSLAPGRVLASVHIPL